jgi:hypothetical protein
MLDRRSDVNLTMNTYTIPSVCDQVSAAEALFPILNKDTATAIPGYGRKMRHPNKRLRLRDNRDGNDMHQAQRHCAVACMQLLCGSPATLS